MAVPPSPVQVAAEASDPYRQTTMISTKSMQASGKSKTLRGSKSARMRRDREPSLAKWPVYWRTPKYPVMLLNMPNRLRGQTLAARHHQLPTAFRIKPKSGFVEVEVPVPTYKHQRPDISKNYGAIMELRKKYPDDLSCGLSGGFKSASDGKDKGTMGNLTYEELFHSYNECVGQKFQTQIYEGRIQPVDMDGPIQTLAIIKGMEVFLVPVFARVILRPGQVHHDVFEQMEAVKLYSDARKATYEPRDGDESGETSDEGSSGTATSEDVGVGSGDESEAPSSSEASVSKSVYKEDTPELPGHDADYPATDYADTDEEDKKNAEPLFTTSATSEAKDVNLSVKSADEKADERTAIQKQLDEISEEKWKVCEWIDEDVSLPNCCSSLPRLMDPNRTRGLVSSSKPTSSSTRRRRR